MDFMLCTLLTFQEPSSWSNALAYANMYSMLSTRRTSQELRSWLKALQPLNVIVISTTLETSQRVKSSLKRSQSTKSPLMLVTMLVSHAAMCPNFLSAARGSAHHCRSFARRSAFAACASGDKRAAFWPESATRKGLGCREGASNNGSGEFLAPSSRNNACQRSIRPQPEG
eukprot:scaffold1337_cov165-Pinguiococcus_pyrenoidosus.AAC.6